MCLVKKTIIEDHRGFDPSGVGTGQQRMGFVEIIFGDGGLPLLCNERLFEKEAARLQGQQFLGNRITRSLCGEHEDGVGIVGHERGERVRNPPTKLCGDGFGFLNRPVIVTECYILIFNNGG